MTVNMLNEKVPFYFTRTLLGIHVDISVLDQLVQKHLPAMHRALCDVDGSFHTPTEPIHGSGNWFTSVLCDKFKYTTTIRFLDLVHESGRLGLLRVMLGLFMLLEPLVCEMAERDSDIGQIQVAVDERVKEMNSRDVEQVIVRMTDSLLL